MSYGRHVPPNEESPLHKVKATYWETKQRIMSKIKKNDDEHIQASDAELDAKIEALKSVQRTTDQLMRLVNEYEYTMFALAKNEYAFSRFLKTQSEVDKTKAGKIMAAVGRVENFSSQQRLGFRQPLERLYQECETFRLRAVADTSSNLEHMETARNDYRAALMWMKDVSEELDPDTHKQLDKFRKVQGQVKKKKELFDRLKLDVMQKVDMLAASRANMFSRALEYYQKWLLEYWIRSARTLEIVSKGFSGMYQYYEFNVIKDLAEPNKLLADRTGTAVDDEQTEAVIKELEATITELSGVSASQRLNGSGFGRSRHDDTTRDDGEKERNGWRDSGRRRRRKRSSGSGGDEENFEDDSDDRGTKNGGGGGGGDSRMEDLLGGLCDDDDDGNDNASKGKDEELILAEDESLEKDGSRKKKKTGAGAASTGDLLSSDFFDIEKADSAMAELHKRQPWTHGGAETDEQLLLSLPGQESMATGGVGIGGGMGGGGQPGPIGEHEELKLLDELLSVMNQAVNDSDKAAGTVGAGLETGLGDLNLTSQNWQQQLAAAGDGGGLAASGRGAMFGSDLDFLHPAEAQALLPSQLLEMQNVASANRSAQLFSMPLPFGTGNEKVAGNVQKQQQQQQQHQQLQASYFVQEQQRSGLLLGPSSVGRVVSSDQSSLAGLQNFGAGGSKQDNKAAQRGGGAAVGSGSLASKFDLFADLDPFANPDAIGKQKSSDGGGGGGDDDDDQVDQL